MGFTHSRCDHSLFAYRHGNDTTYTLLYVDYMLLAISSHDLLRQFMTLLAKEFPMKDYGPLTYFFGVAMTSHANRSILLSQQKYARELLHRSGLESCKLVITPVDIN